MAGKAKVRTPFRHGKKKVAQSDETYVQRSIDKLIIHLQREYLDIQEQQIEDLTIRVKALEDV